MELSTVIKLKKNMNVTDLSGEKVMIDFESGKYFMIKGSGNAIWDIIQAETTVSEIIHQLLEEYDVSKEDCTTSVIDFLEQLRKLDIIYTLVEK